MVIKVNRSQLLLTDRLNFSLQIFILEKLLLALLKLMQEYVIYNWHISLDSD